MKSEEQHIKDLEHVRDWLHSHPLKVDQDVRPAAIDWVNGELAEMKNSRNGVGAVTTDRAKVFTIGFILAYAAGRRQARGRI